MYLPVQQLVSLAAYVDRRDRILEIDAGVVVGCIVPLVGAPPEASLLGLVAGMVAAIGMRAALARVPHPAPVGPAPAGDLDRLVLVPIVALALTAVVSILRW